MLPEVERKDILFAYYRKFCSSDADEKFKYALAWDKFEDKICNLFEEEDNL